MDMAAIEKQSRERVATVSVRQAPEPGLRVAIDDYGFKEHGPRTDPEPALPIQGTVYDERLFGLRMPRFSNDFVLISFIVSIAAWLNHRVSCRRFYHMTLVRRKSPLLPLLVILVGVIAGMYSSIGIAAQLMVSYEEGEIGRLWNRVRGRREPAAAS